MSLTLALPRVCFASAIVYLIISKTWRSAQKHHLFACIWWLQVDPNQGGENGAKKDKFDKIDAVDKDKEKDKEKKDKNKKEKKKKPKKEGAPKASEESMARKSAAKWVASYMPASL